MAKKKVNNDIQIKLATKMKTIGPDLEKQWEYMRIKRFEKQNGK